MPPKRVILLGSTGSIGRNALEVIAAVPGLEVAALSSLRRTDLLREQIDRFRPDAAWSAEPGWSSDRCRAHAGPQGLIDMVRDTRADIVLAAITGSAGLAPALAAVESGKDVALANKEALVVAGPILSRMAEQRGVKLLPVDSEHSAIFQALHSGRPHEVKSITLTASGGPFWKTPLHELAAITPAQAVAHPIWAMGRKISVDSATMMNKALEIIETCYLFGVAPEAVRVLIHPQSIVHSLVEFVDNSVIAQLGMPDMKIPIQYALTFPERLPGLAPRLDLAAIGRLEFIEPDARRFPAIALGYAAAARGGTAGAVFNGANEGAVAAFLDGRIAFTDVVPAVEAVFHSAAIVDQPSLAEAIAADRWGRESVERWIGGRAPASAGR